MTVEENSSYLSPKLGQSLPAAAAKVQTIMDVSDQNVSTNILSHNASYHSIGY